MPEADCTSSWREVPGFPGYMVSDTGEIWSSRCQGHALHISKWHKRRFSVKKKTGYLRVLLMPGRASKFVHVLVLEAFVGPCPEGMQCRHFPDPDTQNNNLSNLSWASRSQNQADRTTHGTSNHGERNPNVKLTDPLVRQLRKEYSSGQYDVIRLATEYGVNERTVEQIVARKTWKHVV